MNPAPLSLDRQEKNLLKKISGFAKNKKIRLYIVGGFLRDKLLHRQKDNPDIDFSLKKGAINFAKRLAKRLKAGFVILDREHGACRLVKRLNEKTYTLDFTDFRGNGLKQDLLHRDFTINTLTVELEKIFISPNLSGLIIDPYSGREDLKKKLIRVVNKRAFDEDPLRILRAFSLSSIFAFKIDKDTLRLIRLKKQKLARVS